MRHPFIRTLAGQKDPYFKNTTLLLHGDGTNGGQNNTFVDGSTNNFTITRNGNTTQGTFSPYGDNWSNFFDGNGDSLRFNSSGSAVNFTGAYTIECFFYLSSNLTYSGSFGAYAGWLWSAGSPGNNGGIQLSVKSSGTGTSVPSVLALGAYGTATPPLISATGLTIEIGRWHHLAASRDSSNNTAIFLNGNRVVNGVVSGSYLSRDLEIGGDADSPDYLGWFPGYISNFRIIKDAVIYDPTKTTLTVPTAPLTAITNTSLLTCQSNRFRDASTNNFTITSNGDVSVQRFSPFSPTAAYAAGTIGGSGYFDGTGDYLTSSTANALIPSLGDFTAEGWFYITVFSTNNHLFSFQTGGTGFAALRISSFQGQIEFLSSTNNSSWAINSALSGTAPINSWNHVAVTRSGGTFTVYLNGSSVITSTAIASGTSLMTGTINNIIGATYSSGAGGYTASMNGLIADVRAVSSVVYTANFTPPTAPLTAITNTSLLLNFQNAAILDNAMMAVPETVGNAQISTSVKKYGTGSLYFDGTGDYLTAINNPAFSFGTGDFTIECWIYIAGNSAQDGNTNRTANIFSGYATSGAVSRGYAFQIEGNSSTTGTGLSFYNNNSGSQISIIATTSISQNTWHHVAVCRSGTTTRLFLNGSSVASGTLSNQNVNSDYPIMIGRLGYPSFLQELNGYIDDLRITKGVARYTANFIPPTAPFPDF